jgi:hypothetical protein
MSMQRKTRWKGKVLTFYCTAGDHYEPEEVFFKNRATKFRISSNCKGCSKGLAKTKYKASQSKRSEKYHLKRQTAMKRVKAFDLWRQKFSFYVGYLPSGVGFENLVAELIDL